jgi:hypothetical protein
MLRWGRWFHAGFSLLVIATFLLALTGGDTGWGLWTNAVGLIVFPGFFVLTTHLLRRNEAFLHGQQPLS